MKHLMKLFIAGWIMLVINIPFLSPALAEQPKSFSSVQYTCPMHPHYIASEMGACPICGMDLVKMSTDPLSTANNAPALERAVVTIPPETIQNMGVRYGRAELSLFGREIRAYGSVVENDRLRSEVAGRVAGWVDTLAVKAVGDQIKKGTLLYRLYSPDLVAAQRDYLSALSSNNTARTQAAGSRLKALGVSDGVISTLKKNRRVIDNVPFHAKVDGVLSELKVREGAYLRPGETLAVIQSYASVWVNAAVAEQDLFGITKSTPVTVVIPNLPGQTFNTEVDYIHPTVDSTTRTGTVRLVLPNEQGVLRPGTFADIVFEIGADYRLAVPDSSLLIDTQGTSLVLALGDGRFQPRSVKTGISSKGLTEILEGVDENDRIVVSGQFLIDSESALRESFQKLQRLKLELADLTLSPGEMAMVDHLVDAGLYIHEALVDGYDLESSQLQPAREIRDMLWPRFGQTRLGPILENAQVAIAAAQEARTESQIQRALNQLGSALEPWIQQGRGDYYRDKGVLMFRGETSKQVWLQIGTQPYSPYQNESAKLVQ